jgi:hypothetical protein
MSLQPEFNKLAVAAAADNITAAALPTVDPFTFTSIRQNLAIGIIIAFAALAFVVLCVRVAGRLSAHQFGLGKRFRLYSVSNRLADI